MSENAFQDDTLEILHALRVKGLATPEVLAALSGIAPEDLPGSVAPLIERGLVVERTGRFTGYLPTPDGRAEAERLLERDPATTEGRAALSDGYTRFLPLNATFKEVCSRWQVRPDGTANDHADAAYDAQVVSSLRQIDEQARPLLDELGAALPRLARYAPRLGDALERIEAGDRGAFARPMADSYHDIWMELHQDLLLTLGQERTAADG